jgi:hypothetical protein
MPAAHAIGDANLSHEGCEFSPMRSSLPLEELDGPLVLLRRFEGRERPQVPAFAGARIHSA